MCTPSTFRPHSESRVSDRQAYTHDSYYRYSTSTIQAGSDLLQERQELHPIKARTPAQGQSSAAGAKRRTSGWMPSESTAFSVGTCFAKLHHANCYRGICMFTSFEDLWTTVRMPKLSVNTWLRAVQSSRDSQLSRVSKVQCLKLVAKGFRFRCGAPSELMGLRASERQGLQANNKPSRLRGGSRARTRAFDSHFLTPLWRSFFLPSVLASTPHTHTLATPLPSTSSDCGPHPITFHGQMAPLTNYRASSAVSSCIEATADSHEQL